MAGDDAPSIGTQRGVTDLAVSDDPPDRLVVAASMIRRPSWKTISTDCP
jgi:hypothetical protein